MIEGVGKDAVIEADAKGYKSSVTPYRMDLVPPRATLHVASILCEGAKDHGEWNWLNGEVTNHVNKALIHLMAHQAGDTQDDHLGHATCRLMMALEIKLLAAD
jgi:hypothetical protein